MNQLVIYIHGHGGNAEEAAHYRPLFRDCDVIGWDYVSQSPWEAKAEFPRLFDAVCGRYGFATLVANSIGAFYAMTALADRAEKIKEAYLISPVVDMEKLITDMMARANVSEAELHEKGAIKTDFGQTLSWKYLSFVRNNPITWRVPTHILYGENDALTPFRTVFAFAKRVGATLTVMPNGEHWFHTEEQMVFLDWWIASVGK